MNTYKFYRVNNSTEFIFLLLTAILIQCVTGCSTATAHSSSPANKQVVRLARLVIDSAQLDTYLAMLKEGVETSVKEEPGVLALYPVSEKKFPTHITILEIYADSAAYRSHINSSHFQKYKNATMKMVKSLDLVETVPLVPDMKIK